MVGEAGGVELCFELGDEFFVTGGDGSGDVELGVGVLSSVRRWMKASTRWWTPFSRIMRAR